ncbi:MAG: hypothetical protein ACE5K0_00540 [Candidatus Methanofastidiosia archaeon]
MGFYHLDTKNREMEVLLVENIDMQEHIQNYIRRTAKLFNFTTKDVIERDPRTIITQIENQNFQFLRLRFNDPSPGVAKSLVLEGILELSPLKDPREIFKDFKRYECEMNLINLSTEFLPSMVLRRLREVMRDFEILNELSSKLNSDKTFDHFVRYFGLEIFEFQVKFGMPMHDEGYRRSVLSSDFSDLPVSNQILWDIYLEITISEKLVQWTWYYLREEECKEIVNIFNRICSYLEQLGLLGEEF